MFKLVSNTITNTLRPSAEYPADGRIRRRAQKKKFSVGLNGFGRFGQHFLKYWLERDNILPFVVTSINDDFLSVEHAGQLLQDDEVLQFSQFHLETRKNTFRVRGSSGVLYTIPYTLAPYNDIPWLGEPSVFLECSGKYTDADGCRTLLRKNTHIVLISASSPNPDATLVYGFNHHNFDPKKHAVVSYGSCTVNAYVPLAHFMHTRYGVINSDVHVIHNVPAYKLSTSNTLLRKPCTLEWSAKHLLPFLHVDNFTVKYTTVPYTGVSMMDFRFCIKRDISSQEFLDNLKTAIHQGKLKELYGIEESDTGPQKHKFTPHSAVFIASSIQVLDKNVYLQAYFDNENSVNRYVDLLAFLTEKMEEVYA